MHIRAFIHHKRSESDCDCQDRFGINRETYRIAMSDGVSQSIFPQWWAQLLVDYYLTHGHIPESDNDLSPLQQEWQQMLRKEIERRRELAKSYPSLDPWLLENHEADECGAAATLCGVTLGEGGWAWECQGDTCVISVAEGGSLTFHSSREGEFGYAPDYLDSFTSGRGKPAKGCIPPGTTALIVATDALCELLYAHRDDAPFIAALLQEMRSVEDHEAFVAMVEEWRDTRGLHDDDSTLVLIDDLSAPGFDVLHEDKLACATPEKHAATENEDAAGSKAADQVTRASTDAEPASAPMVETVPLASPKKRPNKGSQKRAKQFINNTPHRNSPAKIKISKLTKKH